MSPARLEEAVVGASIVNPLQMNRERSSDSSSDRNRHGPRHPSSSYPGALSDTTQHTGSEHIAARSDEISGHYSVDEYSLPLSDSDNLCEPHDKPPWSERYTKQPSDDADNCTWQPDAEPHSQKQSAKVKLCIEKEYIHVITIDHSRLADELKKRNSMLSMLRNNEDHSKGTLSSTSESAERRTPLTVPRSSARKMLTGESIRKLFRVMSPASRRHRSADLHSSESSVSGDTMTGSKSSLTVDGDLPSNASHAVELNKHVSSADFDKPIVDPPSDGTA